MSGNRYTPPSKNEAEISIFGPGVGECIVLHLGDFEWMVVDSCIDRESKKPIALQYLEKIGVDVTTAVKCFVATHWHDDHISGAAQILKACSSAQFVCSAALIGDEFLQLVTLLGERSFMGNSGVDEFTQIFEELFRRSPNVRRQSVGPTWARADLPILRLPKTDRSIRAEVFALSPSDAAITLALHEIGQLLPTPQTPKRRAVAQAPNHVSVALWVTVENLHILLGSDLEHFPDERLGWKAVLLSPTKPSGKARVVKVPHHGSANAYCQDIWFDLLTPNPIALITPFSSGRKPLPTEDDIKRIRSHTSNIYCTGAPHGIRPHRLESPVERTIREMVRTRRVIQGPMGHIRVRYLLGIEGANPTIDVFEGARRFT